MHRIQNIVVPPRSSSQSRPISYGLARRFYGYNTVRRLYGFVLPLDLTRTTTRLAFHLPSLYFLCKMFLIWTVILLQTSDLFPSWESGYIHSFGQWTQRLEMHDVCWRTFCAICAAFAMEAFVRGLDGGGLGFIQMNANTSPFNLVSISATDLKLLISNCILDRLCVSSTHIFFSDYPRLQTCLPPLSS